MRARTLIPFVLALVAAKLASDHLADPDLFWHLRLGADMLDRGALPTTLEYSWTLAGTPYLANDWLAELAFALAWKAAGMTGVFFLKLAVAVTLTLLVYLASLGRAEGNRRAAGLATALAVFVAATNFAARPVLIGHCFLAAILVVLEAARRGRGWAALWLPLLFAGWINVHGSWPVGIGVLAATAAALLVPVRWGRLQSRPWPATCRRGLLVGMALAPLGLLATPVGAGLLLRPFRLLGRGVDLDVFKEWSPVPWSDPSAWVLAGVALALVIAAARSRRPLPPYDLGLVALTLAMAASSALYHLAFAVVLAPVLAEQLSGRVAAEGFGRPAGNAVIAALAAVSLGAIIAARAAGLDQEVRRSTPVDAVAAIEEAGLAARPGFNYFDWGGYLVLRGIPTFIDGRLEPFLDTGVFDEYLGIERRGDIEAVEARGAQWLLAPPTTRLAAAVEARDGWRQVFADDASVVWTRLPAE